MRFEKLMFVLFLGILSIPGLARSHVATEPGESAVYPLSVDETIVKETETYLEQAVAEDTFSGAVLIAKAGKPIFKKAYGLANKSANTPNNVDTKFNLSNQMPPGQPPAGCGLRHCTKAVCPIRDRTAVIVKALEADNVTEWQT